MQFKKKNRKNPQLPNGMGSETQRALWSPDFKAAVIMNDKHRRFSLWTDNVRYTGVLCSSDVGKKQKKA